MIAENKFMLSGTVCNRPFCKTSPSGIPHFHFLLEHHSVQREAGFSRQAWCRVPVVISGKYSPDITHHIVVGIQVTVHGFISSQQGRNGLSKIVLHAEHIDL